MTSDYHLEPQSEAEIVSDVLTDDVTDNRGRVRLSYMRSYFLWQYLKEEKGRDVIRHCYERWVNCDEYLHFAVWNRETEEKVKEFCVKCAKRGNDVYRWRLKKRLDWIDKIEPVEFFNRKDRDVRGEKTNMLFVTLTYDTKRCSRRDAWENVGEEWNRWISAVRRHYGAVKDLRCFEAFKNGYPHLHAVLIFPWHEFEVSFRDKHGKFRILRKEKDWLDGKWHSNVDVEACYSTGVFGYIKKYMVKIYGGKGSELDGKKRINEDQRMQTLSLLWLFRKQSFSLSEGMRELINDLIEGKHNSNKILFQTTVEGKRLFEYELLGVYTLEELCLRAKPPPDADKKWSFTLLERKGVRPRPR